MQLPKDPHILLSYINTRLRDYHRSFDDLCKSLDIDGEAVTKTLGEMGFKYDEKINQFV